MITVHHLNVSRSFSIVWLLEELGVEYEITHHKRTKGFRSPPALREVHPLGKSPVVVDDGEVLAETGAIVETLVERHGSGKLMPEPGTPAAKDCRYIMHYSEGSLMPPLLVRLLFDRIESAKLPFFAKPIAKGIVKKVDENFMSGELSSNTRLIEQMLDGRDWICGEHFTVADIMLGFPVQVLLMRGRQSESATRNIRAYVDRLKARDGYQAAIRRAGADALEG
ncbi:MAG: glutathione S-transferase [Myxococcota bacterium]